MFRRVAPSVVQARLGWRRENGSDERWMRRGVRRKLGGERGVVGTVRRIEERLRICWNKRVGMIKILN